MFCKISDLKVEIQNAGSFAPRCQKYQCDETNGADIIIRTDLLKLDRYPSLSEEMNYYLESGFYFYCRLLHFAGMMLHSSAVEMDGKAYLFSGHCGMGKSTHTRLWQQVFGEKAQVFNDDKPALRYLDDRWYAYGTPWCGKDGINQNKKVPLVGICFLKQADHNSIRRLSPAEAIPNILAQTPYKFSKRETLDLLLSHVEKLVQEIPIFELENRPEPEAAMLSYETMRRCSEEMNL